MDLQHCEIAWCPETDRQTDRQTDRHGTWYTLTALVFLSNWHIASSGVSLAKRNFHCIAFFAFFQEQFSSSAVQQFSCTTGQRQVSVKTNWYKNWQIPQYKCNEHSLQQTKEEICFSVRISVLKTEIHLNKIQRGVTAVWHSMLEIIVLPLC